MFFSNILHLHDIMYRRFCQYIYIKVVRKKIEQKQSPSVLKHKGRLFIML